MRNLKRALSLTLASVMLLGMMVVGSSAAGFPDVTEEDNVEAIEVLKAVEVMVGDDNGNFGPNDPVNRSQMAVVMAKLLNLDYQYYESSCIFWDVPTWARGYVGACYAKGIVSGYGGTTYGAADTVTAVQAASMMMRALGYFQNPEDYKGSFELATVSKGTDIGIFNGVGSSATAPMTRNQVARMALNALRSEMVTFTGTPGITVGDVNVGYRAEYTPRTSTEAKYKAIEDRTSDVASDLNHKGQYYVQLGEELYNGKLKLRSALDVFGRPSRRWEFDGKEIGTYAKKELLDKEYVGKVTGKDLYDELGSENLDEYALTVTVDGVSDPKIADEVKLDPNRNTSIVFNRADLNRNNKAAVGATGTGVQTEVYVDHENDRIYIAVINTYLAIADKDYDEKKEEVPLSVYGVKAAPTSKEYVKLKGNDVTIKLGIEDFDMVTDIAKNDSFLVTLADQEIQTIVPAEVLSGSTISAFKLDDHVVSGGTSYNYTTTATYDAGSLKIYTGDMSTNLKDRTYDIYLDAYGNLIGLKEIEATKNYVFITGLDRNSSNMSNKIADANAIFLDGTSDVIQVNMNKSVWHTDFNNQNAEGEALLNTWCTYTKSGDLYTVKEVISAGDSVKNLYNNVPGVTPDGNDEFGKGNSTGLAQFHQTGKTAANNTDDEFTIDLKRLRLEGGGKSDSAFKYVYGDSDSVYMTAELGELRSGDTEGSYGIIKDASTVATGIIDTSITVWNAQGAMDAANAENDVKAQEVTKSARVSKGVYTLYDDDGTIIAVMAVGEGSAAKDLVYVHTSVIDLESDNGGSNGKAADDGLWTWTRRVIRDGEEVTLTEVGDSAEYINATDMLQYHWYEVRTDGEGNVIKASEAEIALGDTGRDRFVTDYTKINDVVEEDGVDTVLFQSNGGPISGKNFTNGYATDLLVKGNNTLAVDTQKGSGIHFRNDVNVVLQYWNRNTQEIDIMAGEGVDDLKDMVAIVNDNNDYNDRGNNTYYLSALIENGLATEIVIFDSYNTYRNGWTGEGNVTISFEYADYPITRYDFTVNGGDPLTSDDFTVSRGVWSLNVKTNDRLDITLKTATTENFGKQGDRVVVSARNEDHNYLTGTIRSQGYSVRIVPEVAGAYVLLDTFKAVTTEYFTVDVGANVTVTANGKDYTDQTVELEEGTELKIVAGEGYTATVNGKPLNATGKYTLTGNMKIVATKNGEDPKPGAPVEVKVTFSEEAVWEMLKPDGTVLAETDRVAGTEFILKPAYLLTVESGATYDAGEGVYTIDEDATSVVIKTQNGGRWMLESWWYQDGSKLRPYVESEAALARGVKPGWAGEVALGKTFKIIVNMGEGKEDFIFLVGTDGNGIYLEPDVSSDLDGIEDAMIALGFKDRYTMEEADGGEEPVEPSEDHFIKAEISMTPGGSSLAATFTEYYKDTVNNAVDALTPEEIVEALNNSERAVKDGMVFTAAGVSKDKTKAVYTKGTSTGEVTITATPTQVFKVTYPGNTIFVSGTATPTVNDVTSGVVALVKKDTIVTNGNGGLAVVKQAVTLPASTQDVEYVPAVITSWVGGDCADADGNILTGVKKYLTVGYAAVAGEPTTALDGTTATYLRDGVNLHFAPGADVAELKAGQQIVLTIAGKDKLTFTVNEKGTFEGQDYTVKGGDKDGRLGLVAELSAADIPVYLGADSTTPLPVSEDGNIRLTQKAERVLVGWKASDEKYVPVTVTPGTNDVMDIAVADLDAYMNDGEIRLYWAYRVVSDDRLTSGNVWEAYKEYDAEAKDVVAASAISSNGNYAEYFPEDVEQKIYIVAANGQQLGYKGSVVPLSGNLKPVDASATSTAIWEIPVDRNINGQTFDSIVVFTASALAGKTGTALVANEPSGFAAIGGVTFAKGVTITSVTGKLGPRAISDGAKITNATAVVNKAGTGIEFSLTSDKNLNAGAGAGNVYEFEITLSTGITFAVGVEVNS